MAEQMVDGADPAPDLNGAGAEAGAAAAFPAVLHAAVAAGLIALGDWLFWGYWPGLSLALFLGALNLAVIVVGRKQLATAAAALLVAALSLAPLIEAVTVLSIGFAIIGTGAVAMMATEGLSGMLVSRIATSGAFVCMLPVSAVVRAEGLSRALFPRDCAGGLARAAALWFVPLALSAVFLWLFSAANPVIERWIGDLVVSSAFSPWSWLTQGGAGRLLFWLVLAATVLPFALPNNGQFSVSTLLRDVFGTEPLEPSSPPGAASPAILSEPIILRSLLLFNLLFAVQTFLDLTILWQGGALPGGLTYAQYAHRGAYPLIATALMAGAFVLIASTHSQERLRPKLIDGLVILWVLQNVLLVLSSLVRLRIYVELYSMTQLRIAAAIWMALVAIGLVLILIKVLRGHSSRWLINANAVALLVTLYACCFVNFPYYIASYNLRHCREVTGTGTVLDRRYLASLGPDAIPAIDRFGFGPGGSGLGILHLGTLRYQLSEPRDRPPLNWRSWTRRAGAREQYLHQHPWPGVTQ